MEAWQELLTFEGRGGVQARTAQVCHTAKVCMWPTKPAAHAELAANGIIECASGRAP